jgi:hypothetical protein
MRAALSASDWSFSEVVESTAILSEVKREYSRVFAQPIFQLPYSDAMLRCVRAPREEQIQPRISLSVCKAELIWRVTHETIEAISSIPGVQEPRGPTNGPTLGYINLFLIHISTLFQER